MLGKNKLGMWSSYLHVTEPCRHDVRQEQTEPCCTSAHTQHKGCKAHICMLQSSCGYDLRQNHQSCAVHLHTTYVSRKHVERIFACYRAHVGMILDKNKQSFAVRLHNWHLMSACRAHSGLYNPCRRDIEQEQTEFCYTSAPHRPHVGIYSSYSHVVQPMWAWHGAKTNRALLYIWTW